MNANQIMKIFSDTAYVRTGGSSQELQCAEYLRDCCINMGLEASLEAFEVDMATIQEAECYADGIWGVCKI